MCGAGLAASAAHVKFTTTFTHTLLFEVVVFTFKETFSGSSAKKKAQYGKINKQYKFFFWHLKLITVSIPSAVFASNYKNYVMQPMLTILHLHNKI